MGILNAKEVAGLINLPVGAVYKLPHRQKIEGSRNVLFSGDSVKSIIENGLPKKANASKFVYDNSVATPFGNSFDGMVSVD